MKCYQETALRKTLLILVDLRIVQAAFSRPALYFTFSHSPVTESSTLRQIPVLLIALLVNPINLGGLS